jgi:hypothetical protein
VAQPLQVQDCIPHTVLPTATDSFFKFLNRKNSQSNRLWQFFSDPSIDQPASIDLLDTILIMAHTIDSHLQSGILLYHQFLASNLPDQNP